MLSSSQFRGAVICVACIALAGLLHLNSKTQSVSLLHSQLFLGDEEHLMREMAESWRDKESLRSDEGESDLPTERLRTSFRSTNLEQTRKSAKFSMLASPSKSNGIMKAETDQKSRALKEKMQSAPHAKPATDQPIKMNLQRTDSKTSSSDSSEHTEANSLVKFAANLAQEIVRR